VRFAPAPGPDSYAVTDAVAFAALAAGAEVLAVRAEDLPSASPVAATLRYAL
jgi:hypothetical protein